MQEDKEEKEKKRKGKNIEKVEGSIISVEKEDDEKHLVNSAKQSTMSQINKSKESENEIQKNATTTNHR